MEQSTSIPQNWTLKQVLGKMDSIIFNMCRSTFPGNLLVIDFKALVHFVSFSNSEVSHRGCLGSVRAQGSSVPTLDAWGGAGQAPLCRSAVSLVRRVNVPFCLYLKLLKGGQGAKEIEQPF